VLQHSEHCLDYFLSRLESLRHQDLSSQACFHQLSS
jgi:hypothetical protein